MFMTGCVVLVMSSCHDKDSDRLWCIGLCHVKECHICIHNVIIEQMTLINMHKTSCVTSWLWTLENTGTTTVHICVWCLFISWVLSCFWGEASRKSLTVQTVEFWEYLRQ